MRFVHAVRRSADAGTLVGCASTLQGLSSNGMIRGADEDDRAAISTFLLNCLRHPNLNVKGSCLDLLGHLLADGTLSRIIGSETLVELRTRVHEIEADEGMEFGSELAALRGLLNEGGTP